MRQVFYMDGSPSREIEDDEPIVSELFDYEVGRLPDGLVEIVVQGGAVKLRLTPPEAARLGSLILRYARQTKT